MRPLWIVHHPERALSRPGGIAGLRALGLGGVVTNVDFRDYQRSAKRWTELVQLVEGCAREKLVVWIYDEDGYPSGAAGGLVLAKNAAFEALSLVRDPSSSDRPFRVRPAYEHTHASNNFYAARRYPNLLDAAACRAFIETTHAEYRKRLAHHFGSTIRAFFTDEPALNAVNIGQIGEKVRKNVRVVDPIDESVRPLPMIPWSSDLPQLYRERWGEDLMPLRERLFAGDSAAARETRRRFWSLVSDLVAERYFGAIESWCHEHGVASSGHTLREESPIHHVPLEGNALAVLGRMAIPGLDMLSSDPEVVVHIGWLTASLPMSAAILNGRRRVMTEVSDFIQTMGGQPPASLRAMQATAAWQAAFGVTEFALYYNPDQRQHADFKAYGDYVGRLNAVLRDARPAPRALLYYPIGDLWAEYLPVAGNLAGARQSPRARRVEASFLRTGRRLVEMQIPLAIADDALLATASVDGGEIGIGAQRFSVLLLPDAARTNDIAGAVVRRFRAAGGTVLRDATEKPVDLRSLRELAAGVRLEPATQRVVVGRFLREDREILLLVNVAKGAWQGRAVLPTRREWWIADPATGTIETANATEDGAMPLQLAPRTALLVVGEPKR